MYEPSYLDSLRYAYSTERAAAAAASRPFLEGVLNGLQMAQEMRTEKEKKAKEQSSKLLLLEDI